MVILEELSLSCGRDVYMGRCRHHMHKLSLGYGEDESVYRFNHLCFSWNVIGSAVEFCLKDCGLFLRLSEEF